MPEALWEPRQQPPRATSRKPRGTPGSPAAFSPPRASLQSLGRCQSPAHGCFHPRPQVKTLLFQAISLRLKACLLQVRGPPGCPGLLPDASKSSPAQLSLRPLSAGLDPSLLLETPGEDRTASRQPRGGARCVTAHQQARFIAALEGKQTSSPTALKCRKRMQPIHKH